MNTPLPNAPGPMQPEFIQQHLQQVLASPLFRKAGRQTEFLRYVVEHALGEPGVAPKEFCIAMAVYNRPVDYDPKVDPIVRVEASRLRSRLRDYYDLAPDSPIRIELPKGTYMPQFLLRQPQNAAHPVLHLQQSATLAVTPFRNLGAAAGDQCFCDGLTEELLYQLVQSPALQVLARKAHLAMGSNEQPATHLVEGSVRSAGNRVRITLHVMELATARVAYSTVYQHELNDVLCVQEAVASSAAIQIAAALLSERSGWELTH